MNPKISVVIPFFNSDPLLFNALARSIKEQNYNNYEVIVVDDGSTDKQALENLDKYSADPQFRIMHVPHGGIGAARNAGMKSVSGDLLWFVDSDDLILPNAFTEIAEFFTANPDYDFLQFPAEQQKPNGDVSFWKIGWTVRKPTDFTGRDAFYSLTHNTFIYDGYLWRKVFNIRNINVEKLPEFSTDMEIYEDKYWLIETTSILNKGRLITSCFYRYNYNRKSVTRTDEVRRIRYSCKNSTLIIDLTEKIIGGVNPRDNEYYQASIGFYFRVNHKYFSKYRHDAEITPVLRNYLDTLSSRINWKTLRYKRFRTLIAVLSYKIGV